MNTVISTTLAPQPIGPYSQAVQAGNLIFISGQIALHPETGMFENDSLASETYRVMENLKGILSAAGVDFSFVVKTTIFLMDMAFFPEVNEIYGKYFDSGCPPARETVAVAGLPKNARVEISMIANKG